MKVSAAPGAAGDRALPGLQLVRRRSRTLVHRRAGPFAPLVIVGGIVAAAIVFGVLLEQVVLAQSAFKLADLRSRLAAQERRHEALLLDAAKLESPDRIERYARDQLGMVEPAGVEYVVAKVRARGGLRFARAPGTARLVAPGVAAAAPPDTGRT